MTVIKTILKKLHPFSLAQFEQREFESVWLGAKIAGFSQKRLVQINRVFAVLNGVSWFGLNRLFFTSQSSVTVDLLVLGILVVFVSFSGFFLFLKQSRKSELTQSLIFFLQVMLFFLIIGLAGSFICLGLVSLCKFFILLFVRFSLTGYFIYVFLMKKRQAAGGQQWFRLLKKRGCRILLSSIPMFAGISVLVGFYGSLQLVTGLYMMASSYSMSLLAVVFFMCFYLKWRFPASYLETAEKQTDN